MHLQLYSLGQRWPCLLALGLCLLGGWSTAQADIRIAVASNFKPAFAELLEEFAATQSTAEPALTAIYGSTGKLYNQISHGAPFDALFAADQRRPRLLEDGAKAIAGSRFTYAIGRLVLWSRNADLLDNGPDVLQQGGFRFLAMANPELAPYGLAAQQALNSLDIQAPFKWKLVRGENINQAFLFAWSGNAELAFIARSQWVNLDPADRRGGWPVPQNLHQPIEQQAVSLRSSPRLAAFMHFVRTPRAAEIIRRNGYDLAHE